MQFQIVYVHNDIFIADEGVSTADTTIQELSTSHEDKDIPTINSAVATSTGAEIDLEICEGKEIIQV